MPTFSLPNACTSYSAKSSLSLSSSSSSNSGNILCVGVSYTTSFEFEAIAEVGNAAASSVCVPDNRNVLGFEGGDYLNGLENPVSGNIFLKNPQSPVSESCV